MLGLAIVTANKMRSEDPQECSVTYNFTMALLFIVQMGEHTSVNKLAVRVLSMTMAMLTFFMFMYYNCDITAEMTSGPPEIPIKNFQDVLHQDYR